ncbi:hypothetical protein TNCV_2167111 [Trichonephila clavipes]|nr:hypothetical protein TNCV_2167111 [Trichonephila clavipes]
MGSRNRNKYCLDLDPKISRANPYGKYPLPNESGIPAFWNPKYPEKPRTGFQDLIHIRGTSTLATRGDIAEAVHQQITRFAHGAVNAEADAIQRLPQRWKRVVTVAGYYVKCL